MNTTYPHDDFPAVLRALLKKHGLQIKELANRIGKSQSYVSQLATAVKPPPNPEVMRKIVESLEGILPADEEKLMKFAQDRTTSQLFVLESKPLKALLERVPKRGDSWSKAEVDAWLEAMRGVLYFEYPPNGRR